jgi:2-phospho-L-lactate guanylyltransferase
VQATVSSFDPVTRAGTVLLDDGVELAFDGPAVDTGEFRLLRSGQRVAVTVDGRGRVSALRLPAGPQV